MTNEEKRIKESLAKFDEEVANLHELHESYLLALTKHFPRYTHEELVKRSKVLNTLANNIEGSSRKKKYYEDKGYSYSLFTLDDAEYASHKKLHSKQSQRYTKAFLSMIKVRDSPWRCPVELDRDLIKKTNTIHLASWYLYFDPRKGEIFRSKDLSNWFRSYLVEPKFSVGDIVSLRSAITENAVKYEVEWHSGSKDLRTKYMDKSFKKKTFMVLGESDLTSRYYEKTYKPNANGGMRRYKVLPVGDTTVYYIIERALKKNRTKAVKDAKRT